MSDTNINSIEFYYKLASVMSQLTLTKRFDPTDIETVTIDDVEYKIGPFYEVPDVATWGEAHYVFSLPETDYCIGMADDQWSSWGHMYDDEGNDFIVIKKSKPRIVYDYEWADYNSVPQEVKTKFQFPLRRRW